MSDQTDDAERVVPVVEEKVNAGRRVVKTGSVRVQKYVDKRVEKISMPLMRETVEVHRVAINRVVDSIPEVRTIGDTTIIPVVEEELVVTRRLVLKEEVHMTRRRTRREEAREVVVGKERAEVVRMDAEGRIESKTQRDAPFPIGNHKPVLGRS